MNIDTSMENLLGTDRHKNLKTIVEAHRQMYIYLKSKKKSVANRCKLRYIEPVYGRGIFDGIAIFITDKNLKYTPWHVSENEINNYKYYYISDKDFLMAEPRTLDDDIAHAYLKSIKATGDIIPALDHLKDETLTKIMGDLSYFTNKTN
jgi:hypothetical protein